MNLLNYKQKLSPIQEEKKKLRSQFLKLLSSLSEEKKIISSQKCNLFLIDYITKKYADKLILSFNSLGNELNIMETNRFLANGNQLVLPRVNKTTQELDCYLVPRLTLEYVELSDKFGILEPIPETCELIDLSRISLIILPGLAFDIIPDENNKYNRLGRGKGYYDKLLAKLINIEKIGICFEIQRSNEPIPSEDHDQKIDLLYSF